MIQPLVDTHGRASHDYSIVIDCTHNYELRIKHYELNSISPLRLMTKFFQALHSSVTLVALKKD
ncbi:MAG: hypothetical protein IJ263_00715, partial [Paludibacteraceae bacterium]|nr:hypothetical protein [Paludibacteraceae bacterium]